jgi:hypothetical protein
MKKHSVPTCVECSCTEAQACPGGCSWVELNKETNEGICSKCVIDLAAQQDVQLVTPRWVDWDAPGAATPEEYLEQLAQPIGSVIREEGEWFLALRIEGEFYKMPVHDGEPEGEQEDAAPGVKQWGAMKRYGLERLGPGVWKLSPSLWAPGALHAFIVLRDVPEPAPFARSTSLLVSPSGERLQVQR